MTMYINLPYLEYSMKLWRVSYALLTCANDELKSKDWNLQTV